MILLVEDDDDFRQSAAHLLAKAGYEVIAENDAKSAKQRFQHRSNDISLIITDVVMPGSSGSELERFVRSLGADIPVLYMSGRTTEVLLEQGLIDQPSRILHKPFSAEQLFANINAALITDAASLVLEP